ncbi:MAG: hypothetical protein L0I76_22010 [Pseudonocardia sp.]|nr:hypothetical protein [Pseudonocardia sp.]
MPDPTQPGPPGGETPDIGPSCRICATTAESSGTRALTWVRERDDHDRERWLCPACARRHVRDIETKLAHEWW